MNYKVAGCLLLFLCSQTLAASTSNIPETNPTKEYPYGSQVAYGLAGFTGGFLIGVAGTLITSLTGGITPASSGDILLAGGAAGAVVGSTYMVHYSGQRNGYDGRFWPLAGGAVAGAGVSLAGGLLITPAVFWVTFPILTLTGAIIGYQTGAKPTVNQKASLRKGAIRWKFLQTQDKLAQSNQDEAEIRYSLKASWFY